MTRSLLILAFVAASLAQLLALPLSAADPVPKLKDPGRIQGTWKVVELKHNGEVNRKHFREGIWIFRDKEVTLRDENGREYFKGTFFVNTDGSPMTLDITWSDGPRKRSDLEAIYRIEKNTLTLSHNAGKRPEAFTHAGKVGRPALLTLKRVESR